MNILETLKKIRRAYLWTRKSFLSRSDFGSCGTNTVIQLPLRIYEPKSVYLAENVKISAGMSILNAPAEKVIIKRYTAIAANCTIVPGSHRSTVTVPHFLLGPSHINDKTSNIIINEDVWIGTNVTILSGVELGRGCIVSAGSIVTKSIPPYAVVVGAPAKIFKVKFSIEQILKHEAALYPESERYSREELEQLFAEYYQDKKVFGTEEGLSDEALERIEIIKKSLHFIP